MRLESYVVRRGPVARVIEEAARKRREAAEAAAREAKVAEEAAERERREVRRQLMEKAAEDEVAVTEGRSPPSVQEIKRAVCSHFRVSHTDLISRRRTAEIITPRHIAMFLAKQMTLQSLPQIARQFGRDHTTIMHGVQHIEDRIATGDSHVSAHVAAVRAMLEGGESNG